MRWHCSDLYKSQQAEILLQVATKPTIRMAALVMIVEIIQCFLAMLWIDGQQNCVDLCLHPVITFLRLWRANMQKNGKPGDLPEEL